MNKIEFKQKLSRIKTAKSVTGKKYSSIQIFGDSIEFVRENKTKPESISISELFELFTKENSINTTIAKSYISGRVQSPAVAILNQLKTVSFSKNNAEETISYKTDTSNKKEEKLKRKIKDETKFFRAFSEVVGIHYLQSKSVDKAINSSHIFLSNNYTYYLFNQETNDCYLKILADLKSNKLFSSDSLSHYVDGIVFGHPILKNRIIEFDEEQHFTPARMDTLQYLSQILSDNYFSKFREICTNKKYLNEFVLKKHRIKNKLETVPKSFIDFVEWLEKSNEKTSGYICNKNGFEFLGGRIAQRAYYDCLRDTAHLSEKNKGFESPLRFAKKTFEDKEKVDFSMISNKRIKEIIIEVLKIDYDIIIPNA